MNYYDIMVLFIKKILHLFHNDVQKIPPNIYNLKPTLPCSDLENI